MYRALRLDKLTLAAWKHFVDDSRGRGLVAGPPNDVGFRRGMSAASHSDLEGDEGACIEESEGMTGECIAR